MSVDQQTSCLRVLFLAALLAATLVAAAPAGSAATSPKTSSAQKAHVAENYGKLPLSFEANAGQANKSVKFLSQGCGYGLYLTGNEAVLTLRKTISSATRPDMQLKLRPIQEFAPFDVVWMRLAGASDKAKPMGEEQLPGTANYFIGNDPARWRTSIPTYAKVRYSAIYPGVDLVYYGNQQQLEYDFVVAQGADPASIQLRFTGAKELRLEADGDMAVTAANGTLIFRKPLIYQIVDGHRHLVEGDFARLTKHTVGFRLGNYDHTKALVIDPVLVYSTYLGGSGADSGHAISVDAAGNVYMAGQTSSTDFSVTPGAFQTTNNGAANSPGNAFVTKLNPTGTALVYSTYLGGSGSQFGADTATGLAVDSSGNAYVTGAAYSSDFPVTQGAFQTTNKAAANEDATAFVTKLNPTGTALIYSTYLGGSGVAADSPYSGDSGHAIAVDANGDAYVTGQTYSVNFPVTQGVFQTMNNAASRQFANAFVTKLNPAGTALVYSTYLGGSGDHYYGNPFDAGNAIAVDSAGNAYVAGQTPSTDFPVTQGAFQTTNHALQNYSANAFVTKLNPAGTALVYSTYLGGSSSDTASGVAVDSAGNVYVTGTANSTDFPVTPGAFQTTNHNTTNGGSNAFVTKLDPTGTALVYSTYLGGSGGVINLMPTLGQEGGDQASGLATDSSGNVYVTGSTASADFPVTQGAYQTANNDQSSNSIGGYNAFVTELNPAGTALVYSTYLGGNGINPADLTGVIVFGEGDQAFGLALDSSRNVYVTGSAASADFPVTQGAFQTMIHSGGNAFVTKMELSATATTAITPTVAITPVPSTITSAQPLTVTVAVSGGSGSATPSGTVTLSSPGYSSTAATLNGGSATFDIPAGTLLVEPFCYPSPDVLTANYVPDAASSSVYNFSSGTSSVNVLAPCFTVTPSSTTLTWAQSQSLTLAVAIAGSGGTGEPTPTGTVTISTGRYSSATTPLSAGNANISIPAGTLTTGFNVLKVNYSGDSNYTALADAGSVLVTVGSVTVTVTPSASSITTAQALPVAITVSAGNGSPTPTGMVTLLSTNYSSATTPLTNGSATITILAGSLPVGVDPLNVDYGDGNYGGASGSASVTVTGGGSSGFTITGAAVTVAPGATTGNTSTITVTPSGGFTGSVALTAAVTSRPSGATDPPTLSFGLTNPVTIRSANPGTAKLTIMTTAAGGCTQADRMSRELPWYSGGGAALACVLLFGFPARRRRWQKLLGMLLLLTALVSSGLACSGGSSSGTCNVVASGTMPGAYTITITGTSGATTATGSVSLTVQ